MIFTSLRREQCWGGLVHVIDPSSFGTWCDDHFELLVHLGSKVFFMAGFADLITSLEHYEVTVPAGATTMGEVLGSAEFLETVHGAESLVSHLYESSPVPVNGVVSFHVMRSVKGLLSTGGLFGDEIYYRDYYGNQKSSGVDHYDRVEADWKKLSLRPPDDMLYCFNDSAIMKHLAQYSSYELLCAYGEDHPPVPSHVFYQQQGRKLTGGAVGYYFTTPDRERVLILTDQRWLVVGNEDRYTEASMRTKPLYDYIYGALLATLLPMTASLHTSALNRCAYLGYATPRLYLAAISWLHPGYISATSRLHLGYISAAARLYLGYIPATSRLHLGYISAAARLYLGCISVYLG